MEEWRREGGMLYTRTGSRLSRLGRLEPPSCVCVCVCEVIRCLVSLLSAGIGRSSPEPAAIVLEVVRWRGGEELRRLLEACLARTVGPAAFVLLLRRGRPTIIGTSATVCDYVMCRTAIVVIGEKRRENERRKKSCGCILYDGPMVYFSLDMIVHWRALVQ